MKKLLLLFIFCSVWLLNAQVVWNGNTKIWNKGIGSEGDPFLIENGENLAYLAQSVYSGNSYENVYFLLTENLDLGGAPSQSPRQSWFPIGMSLEKSFNGNFDGGGKTIANLYVSTSNEYAGLFGYTGGGSLKNIGIVGSSSVSYIVSTGYSCYIGAIVGYSKSSITNCYNTGSVTSYAQRGSYLGGIAGLCSASISNCYNTGSISSNNYGNVGGIVGSSRDITILDCYNTGSISSGREAGGIAGSFSGTIERCYNTGSIYCTIDITSCAGGLVGSIYSGDMFNCFNRGSVIAKAIYSGSSINGVFTKSCSGGLIGESISSSLISVTNSYSTGNIQSESSTTRGTSTAYGGRIVGKASSVKLINCFCRSESEFSIKADDKIYGSSGDSKSESELKAGSFVMWLNNGMNPQIWFTDNRVNVNDGYPILVYKKIFDINVTADGNGNVTGSGEYIYNSEVELVASADENYHFAGWNDGNAENPRKLIVKSDGDYVGKFAINRHLISVTGKNGVVTGIGEYDYGTDVSLTAIADYGYHFSDWGDGNNTNPRLVTVISDSLFKVNFTPNPYTITLNAGANGSVSGGGVFDYDAEVVLNATADEHYHFVKWNDGNIENPRKVKVGGDITYSAEFAIDIHNVTIISGINGNVIGAGEFIYGSQIFLTAVPNEGFSFVKWSDGSVENPRKVSVEDNMSFQAEFVINRYQVTVAAGANGVVTGTGEFTYGTLLTITATAEAGYHFVKWNDGNKDNPRTVIVNSVLTYLAEFAINVYDLSVSSDGNGTVTGGGKYEHGLKATLVATADEHYHFVKWSDGNVENPRFLNVVQDGFYDAEFAANKYIINVLSNLNGSVFGGGEYDYKTVAILTATANDGYHFLRWSDGNTENPRTMTVTSDATVVAEFTIKVYKLNVMSGGNGTVSGDGSYEYGSVAVLKATADANYHFEKWNDGNVENPRTVSVTGDGVYGAEFAIDKFLISGLSDSNGSVSGSGEYDYGAIAVVEATANDGYSFVKWNDGSVENPRTINVTSVFTVVAEFGINSYNLSVLSNGNGTVIGGGSYEYGSVAVLKATADANYHFEKWNDGNIENPRTVNVTGDGVYKAEFGIDKFLISTLSGSNGSVSGSGEYDYGAIAVIEATANDGYSFVKWNDGSVENPRTINVTSVFTVVAEFGVNSYNLSVLSNGNGTVTGGGSYEYGSVAVLTATADANYHFTGWDDGNVENPRTVNVTGDGVYRATFASDKFAVTVIAGENGTVTGTGEYNYGSLAVLNAISNEGYRFVKWNDGNVENPRTLTVTSSATFVAEFAVNMYDLNVVSKGNGVVTGSGSYEYGSIVVLQATADNGYSFGKWSDGNIDNPRSVKVIDNVLYEVEFIANQYSVSVVAGNNGSVSGGGKFDYGTSTVLTAAADANYHFEKWDDGNVENPRSISVTGDVLYKAVFAADKFMVTVMAKANGSATGTGEYSYNSMAVMTAIADEGYRFLRWNDGNEDNPRAVKVLSESVFTAEFEKLAPMLYVVDILTSENGSVVVKKGGLIVESGDSVTEGALLTISMNPDEGYILDKIFVNGVEVNSTVVKVDSDVVIEVLFKLSDGVDDLMENDVKIFSFNKTVTVDSNDKVVDILVVNMGGVIVSSLKSVEGKNEIKIEQSGVYVVRVGNISRKVVIN